MRGSRLWSKVVGLLLASALPAVAALPPAAIADLRVFPLPPSFIAAMPPLFDTQEIFRGDPSPFRQWTDMLERASVQFATVPAACTDRRPECVAQAWWQLVDRLAPLPLREKVVRANAALNAVAYVPSKSNWSRASYWETPLEFLAHGGQCQDYATAKYVLLRQAGIRPDAMRIVVLRATALAEDHAVLVVDIGGEVLMLDDERAGVIRANAETSYRPYYSINELGWWQHVAGTIDRSPDRLFAADMFAAAARFTRAVWRNIAR